MNVVFADATEGFTPVRKDEKACGGILTSLTIIPRLLARAGMDVTVKSSFQDTCEIEGVKYIPIGLKEKLPKWDVLIVNRNGINLSLVKYAHSIGSKVVWWLHDIVDMRYLEDSSYREVDKIVALSQYCKTSYSKFYDLPESRFVVIPNGVDKSVFYPGKYEDRKLHRMIMAGALIKGYTPIRDTWLNVKRQFSDAELMIYSSQSLHDKVDKEDYKVFLHEMEESGAKVMNPIAQSVLADKMRGAGVLLMPNSYPEICSNLLLQAQACGLPVVASNIGSVGEFIKDGETGVLTEFAPHDMWLWMKMYIEAVVKLLKEPDRQKDISRQSSISVLGWDDITDRWFNFLNATVNSQHT